MALFINIPEPHHQINKKKSFNYANAGNNKKNATTREKYLKRNVKRLTKYC